MYGLLRAYGTDNGSDSDAGPDGNGNYDIPSYGTQFDKRNYKRYSIRTMMMEASPVIPSLWMEMNREMTKITWSPMMQNESSTRKVETRILNAGSSCAHQSTQIGKAWNY